MNIDEKNIVCITWVNLNTVQYIIMMHIIDEMKKIIYKNFEKCHEILELVKIDGKLSLSILIVEYNIHMNELDENA